MYMYIQHSISGEVGGGSRKKCLSPQKSEKKLVENVDRKKKFVVEIDEKYADQEPPNKICWWQQI